MRRTRSLVPLVGVLPFLAYLAVFLLIPTVVVIVGAFTENGAFAYTTNAGSNFVAGFAVDRSGRLTALNPGGKTGDVGDGASPIDLDHVESRFLYTLEGGRGTIGAFVINHDGSLTARPDTHVGEGASGLQGIAAY